MFNIWNAVTQPCIANPWKRDSEQIRPNGLSEDGTYIMLKIRPDDSSWQCNLKNKDGGEIDFVSNILEKLPEKYRDHLVTIVHDTWVSYSYVPVFDTDIQAIWDKELDDYIERKAAWCTEHGCD